MRRALIVSLLSGMAVALSACVVVQPRPRREGAVWVPGHYARDGTWIPGHWR